MTRTKNNPAPQATRTTAKTQVDAQDIAAGDYQGKKNEDLVGELGRRGVPRPAKINKANLIEALEQDDKKNSSAPQQTKSGARVSKSSAAKSTARPAHFRTIPRIDPVRLRLLQGQVMDIAGWLSAEEDDRLDSIINILGRADRELDRLALTYPPLKAFPKRRTSSAGDPGRRLPLTGGARYGSVDLDAPSPPRRSSLRIQAGRFGSVGADPLSNSPVIPPRSIEEVDDEGEAPTGEGEEEEVDGPEEDDQEEQEIISIPSNDKFDDEDLDELYELIET
ncbi:hypothetical protein CLAFUW4_10857 [Fulvia fulva]|uniref:Uncharacterized protein n=1 Tax=Passalora fulva TaxID=5499 RepID=A0A9Q8PCX9_PASFU|nr:uncharacterized protein CLAFUR5_09899 [Fulvia fulva]KAK4619397.1 hypothetical protein CLAFUR4_10862 [Fulvia fulva]KAK4620878.1 hypothetical protein CLAFUR0_10869 [Fulvia fulva]UJO20249.1 hypothetical protein CLAFUR5_09899 [Fulvia fulva]WPV17558.1 hypothetical protein CLAFUW4_10857 [Fulvia fulva]WPV31851.1 hypothetical protein CLAFUW7_10855 [Fulvia fulva]